MLFAVFKVPRKSETCSTDPLSEGIRNESRKNRDWKSPNFHLQLLKSTGSRKTFHTRSAVLEGMMCTHQAVYRNAVGTSAGAPNRYQKDCTSRQKRLWFSTGLLLQNSASPLRICLQFSQLLRIIKKITRTK